MCEEQSYEDFNLDFLDFDLTKPAEETQAFSEINNINPMNSYTSKRSKNVQKLSSRIARTNELVLQIKQLANECENSRQQLEEFQKIADSVKQIYDAEHKKRIELERLAAQRQEECEKLDRDLANKTLQYDQLQAQCEEQKGPLTYNELAVKFLRIASKVEDGSLHWVDKNLIDEITRYCKDKNLRWATKSPKRPTRKNTPKQQMAVQCDLWQEQPASVPTPKKLPTFTEILTELDQWKLPDPIKPISDPNLSAMDTWTQHTSVNTPSAHSIGTCTDLCNVLRPIDYLLMTSDFIKRSNSRPPSRLMNDETRPIKCETLSKPASPHLSLTQALQDDFIQLWCKAGEVLTDIIKMYEPQVTSNTNTKESNASNGQENQPMKEIDKNAAQPSDSTKLDALKCHKHFIQRLFERGPGNPLLSPTKDQLKNVQADQENLCGNCMEVEQCFEQNQIVNRTPTAVKPPNERSVSTRTHKRKMSRMSYKSKKYRKSKCDQQTQQERDVNSNCSFQSQNNMSLELAPVQSQMEIDQNDLLQTESQSAIAVEVISSDNGAMPICKSPEAENVKEDIIENLNTGPPNLVENASTLGGRIELVEDMPNLTEGESEDAIPTKTNKRQNLTTILFGSDSETENEPFDDSQPKRVTNQGSTELSNILEELSDDTNELLSSPKADTAEIVKNDGISSQKLEELNTSIGSEKSSGFESSNDLTHVTQPEHNAISLLQPTDMTRDFADFTESEVSNTESTTQSNQHNGIFRCIEPYLLYVSNIKEKNYSDKYENLDNSLSDASSFNGFEELSPASPLQTRSEKLLADIFTFSEACNSRIPSPMAVGSNAMPDKPKCNNVEISSQDLPKRNTVDNPCSDSDMTRTSCSGESFISSIYLESATNSSSAVDTCNDSDSDESVLKIDIPSGSWDLSVDEGSADRMDEQIEATHENTESNKIVDEQHSTGSVRGLSCDLDVGIAMTTTEPLKPQEKRRTAASKTKNPRRKRKISKAMVRKRSEYLAKIVKENSADLPDFHMLGCRHWSRTPRATNCDMDSNPLEPKTKNVCQNEQKPAASTAELEPPESLVELEPPASPPPMDSIADKDIQPKKIPLNLPKNGSRIDANDTILQRLIKTYVHENNKLRRINKPQKQKSSVSQTLRTVIQNYLSNVNNNEVEWENVGRNVANQLNVLAEKITDGVELIAESIVKEMLNAPLELRPDGDTMIMPQPRSVSLGRIGHVIQELQRNRCAFTSTFLATIEVHLFKEQGFGIESAINLLHLYLMSIRDPAVSRLAANPARLLIAKCLYYHMVKSHALVYEVLCMFPTVLPHREQHTYNHGDPLITVIQHLLMSHKYDMERNDLRHKDLLSKLRFEYHYTPFKPQRSDVIDNFIMQIRAGKLHDLPYAFALLCKRMPQEKVVADVLHAKLLPLAHEYYARLTATDEFDERAACVLECVSMILRPFALDTDMHKYMSTFALFLNVVDRQTVQEAALQAILRLQRFGVLSCYKALQHYKPTASNHLKPQTKAMLKSFVYRKPLYFWREAATH